MGGKGSVSYPPPANWSSLSEVALKDHLASVERQSQLQMAQMQAAFAAQLSALQEQTVLPDIPEVSEPEDIDWTSEIDAMEADARVAIEEATSLGASSGTIITSPLVWDTEPTVLSTSLLTE